MHLHHISVPWGVLRVRNKRKQKEGDIPVVVNVPCLCGGVVLFFLDMSVHLGSRW